MNTFSNIHKYRCFKALVRGFLYNLLSPNSVGKRIKIGSRVRMYHNIKLSDNVVIDDNVELRCNKAVEIYVGKDSLISRDCVIYGKVSIGSDTGVGAGSKIIGVNHGHTDVNALTLRQTSTRLGIVIGDNVWIGANVVIIDGVQIGEGSIVGAGSVVTKSIPPYSIAVGNPCRVIKNRKL